MIEITQMTKKFGRFVALQDVTLRINAGEAVALWGPNGAGKSTLIRCLLGLLPFRGGAEVAGLNVRKNGKAARRLIGYLPQEPALFDDLRLAEVAVLFARLKRASTADAKQMLRDIGLASHMRKRVRQLSGGMKQRLSLGLALLTNPPVIVLDEPTSNLDADGRRELLDDIARLRDAGKTILLVSHRGEEVHEIADRIVTLESGRIVRTETSPRDPDNHDDDGDTGATLVVEPQRLVEARALLASAGIDVQRRREAANAQKSAQITDSSAAESHTNGILAFGGNQ